MDSTESANTPETPRVLLIVVRGLSPFFLGPYGNEWVHTPTFDRLAARGVVFDQHFSTDLDHEKDRKKEISDLIAKVALGTRAWTGGVGIDEPFPRERHTLLSLRRKLYETFHHIPAGKPLFWIVEIDSLLRPWDPQTKYLRYYFGKQAREDESEPLTPWNGALPKNVAADDDRTLERLQDTFGAVMSAFDRGLAKLLAGCRTRGFGQNAMIVVTSDLAFPLGQQGPVGWGEHGIIEGVAHLPLIIRLPENAHAGTRVSALTEPDDLVETLRSYLAGTSSAGLWPLILGEKEMIRDHLIIRNGKDAAVRTPDRLCIFPDDGEPRLYVKPDDCWEMMDVASKREEEVQSLGALAQDTPTPAAR